MFAQKSKFRSRPLLFTVKNPLILYFVYWPGFLFAVDLFIVISIMYGTHTIIIKLVRVTINSVTGVDTWIYFFYKIRICVTIIKPAYINCILTHLCIPLRSCCTQLSLYKLQRRRFLCGSGIFFNRELCTF